MGARTGRGLTGAALAVASMVFGMAAVADEAGEAATEPTPEERRAALQVLSDDEGQPVDVRIQAVRTLRREQADEPGPVIRSWLDEARLAVVARQSKRRTTALYRAQKEAEKARRPAQAARIEKLREADKTVRRMQAVGRQRARRGVKPETPEGGELASEVRKALKLYARAGDTAQLAWGRLALARYYATVEGAEARAEKLLDLVIAEKSRDVAAVRLAAQQTRQRLFARQERWRDAAAAALAVDRETALPPPAEPYGNGAFPLPVVRSEKTHALCKEVRTRGVDCADLERRLFGSATYFDFGRMPPSIEFDPSKAPAVMEEYGELLQTCVHSSARAGTIAHPRVELEWTIGNDGRIRDYRLDPSPHRGTELEDCIAVALNQFRYPPYKGEMHHIGMQYHVGP